MESTPMTPCHGPRPLSDTMPVRGLAVVVLVCSACHQSIDLPRAGASTADVRRQLGDASQVVQGALAAHESARLHACRPVSGSVVTAWIYERPLHKDVVIVFGTDGRVVCAAHAGVTFVQ